MEKEIINQVLEAHRVPGRINPRRNTRRHITIKLTKIKDRDQILKQKEWKELRTVSETSGTISNAPTFDLYSPKSRREKKRGYEKIFEEIIVENFPNMEKEIVNQVQQVQRVPHMINPRRNIPRHTVIKLTKTKQKERILKAAGKSNKEHTRETPYV